MMIFVWPVFTINASSIVLLGSTTNAVDFLTQPHKAAFGTIP